MYENALVIELRSFDEISIKQQFPIPVFYGKEKVGEYFADILVDDILIVELKSVAVMGIEFEAQLVHYLAATGIDHGLLINFGPSVVIKHKYREYRKIVSAQPQ